MPGRDRQAAGGNCSLGGALSTEEEVGLSILLSYCLFASSMYTVSQATVTTWRDLNAWTLTLTSPKSRGEDDWGAAGRWGIAVTHSRET